MRERLPLLMRGLVVGQDDEGRYYERDEHKDHNLDRSNYWIHLSSSLAPDRSMVPMRTALTLWTPVRTRNSKEIVERVRTGLL
jgi:hypothetical protein